MFGCFGCLESLDGWMLGCSDARMLGYRMLNDGCVDIGCLCRKLANSTTRTRFRYVNIDDCWQVQRNVNGSINSDPSRFPGGMKSLADYIHSRGLKFGVYDTTCFGDDSVCSTPLFWRALACVGVRWRALACVGV
jgi:hypothetical protein